MIKYLHQHLPDAPIVEHNDKPLTVASVKTQPKWPWSENYRAHVRESMRIPKTDPYTMREAYAKWYAAHHDISVSEARRLIAP